VPGETTPLKTKQEGQYLLGWAANDPLEVGAKLTASLRATSAVSGDPSNVGGQFPLVVVGVPTALPEPSFAFPTWFDFFAGEGAPVSCQSSAAAAGCAATPSVQVPGRAVKQTGAELLWQVVPSASGVAWAVRIEASPSQSTDVDVRQGVNEYLANDAEPSVALGKVIFPTPADQYCVTLVLEDLRTQQETRAENCVKPQPPAHAETDSKLGLCDQPPTEALTEAWCRLKPATLGSSLCESLPGDGASGSAGAPAESGGSAPLGGSNASNAPPRSRTSKGCQLGAAKGSPTSIALLLALALLVRQRRVRS